jgi:hypothetical protein
MPVNATKSDNEWYTPARYVEAARAVMGGIDVDPASCKLANQTVRATRYYTKEDNGLMQPWTTADGRPARVWLNPPYGRTSGGGNHLSHQKAFAEKLLREYSQGHVAQAVLLSLGNPSSLWFQPLFDFVICFHRGHITFFRPNGGTGHFGFPLAFVYLGPSVAQFIEAFSPFGRIARAVDASTPRPIAPELWTPI